MHFLAIEDDLRESTQSWREVLLGRKSMWIAQLGNHIYRHVAYPFLYENCGAVTNAMICRPSGGLPRTITNVNYISMSFGSCDCTSAEISEYVTANSVYGALDGSGV